MNSFKFKLIFFLNHKPWKFWTHGIYMGWNNTYHKVWKITYIFKTRVVGGFFCGEWHWYISIKFGTIKKKLVMFSCTTNMKLYGC